MKRLVGLLLAILFVGIATGCGEPDQNNEGTWTLGPFHRPEGVNPVITPEDTSTFDCPMRDSTIHWEAMATFNPAAVVRNGKINVLYRSALRPPD